MAGKFTVMLTVMATCWYLSAANYPQGSDPHHNNYYLAALSFAGSEMKRENEIPENRENRERPVVVVEHIHKEEIEEERVRLVPQHHSNCNHQHHQVQQQQPYYRFPFYPFQYKANRPQNHNEVNQYYGHGQQHGGSFYEQKYGGYNFRSSNY